MNEISLKIDQYFRLIGHALSEKALLDFVGCLTVKHYKKGSQLSHEGRTNSTVCFIEKGAVLIYNTVDHRKNVYNFFFENEFTGDYESFLTRKPAKYSMEAIEDTITYNLHYNDMQRMYDKHLEFNKVGRFVAEAQFLRLTQRNTSLLSEKPEERYLNLITEKPQVLQRVPQYYVASYLGITPEALSRVRKRISFSRE
jgi:CRP-like cAMP-binding protein